MPRPIPAETQAVTLPPASKTDALIDAVMSYRHPGVLNKLVTEEGMSSADAERAFHGALQFLCIAGTNPGGSYGPTLMIDAAWHHLVLHTRDYAAFCDKHFGRFIHHNPNMPGAPRDGMRPIRTLKAADEVFGLSNLDAEVWTYPDKDGNPVLGPGLKFDPSKSLADYEVEATSGPCDSCGCSPCD